MKRVLHTILAVFAVFLPAVMLYAQNVSGLPDYECYINGTGVTAKPRLEDDFYMNTNYDWLTTTKLPPAEPSTGPMDLIFDSVRERLNGIIADSTAKGAAGSQDQKNIAALYACITDKAGRQNSGLGSLAPFLKRIESAQTVQELMNTLAAVEKETGLDTLCGTSVGPDVKSATTYIVYLSGPKTGLGREIYENPAAEKYCRYYQDYIKTMLMLYGRDSDAAEKSAAQIAEFIKNTALHSLKVNEDGDPDIYQTLKLSAIKKLYSSIDAAAMLNAGGTGPADGIKNWTTNQTGAIAYLNTQLTEENLALLKETSIFFLLQQSAAYLSPDYQKARSVFSMTMLGTDQEEPEERIGQELCQETIEFAFSREYAARYFSEQNREQVESYIHKIMQQYRKILTNLDWMSSKTKKKALLKLDKMSLHVGYPDKYFPYTEQIQLKSPSEGGTLIDNMLLISKTKKAYFITLPGKPVNRDIIEWTSQTVNAFYDPSTNSINFPAGFLQAPYYDQNADDMDNLGGIGMVMAHEISHSFDATGSKFDEKGTVKNWWTKKDHEEFTKHQQSIITFYSRYHFPVGAYQNGEQTLTENGADLGAMACLTAIVGDNPEQLRKMYTHYAVCWRQLDTEGMLYHRLTDVHSVPYVRTNAVLSSTDGFYKAFNIKEGDGMYVPPEKRARLW